MRRALRLRVAVLAVLFFGIVGVVLFRVAASGRPHSVLLKWNPPPPKPGVTVASYNVFRGAQSGGPYDPIASGITGMTYTDHDVHRGKTYYYVVSSVNTTGEESRLSREVSASIH